MTKLREVKTLVNKGNKKTMIGSLHGNWKGCQKRDGKLYQVTCTGTANILYLSVNISSITCMLTKVFNVTSDKESVVLRKNTTILKLKKRLDHGNGGGDILAMRLYTSQNGAEKTDKEGKNP